MVPNCHAVPKHIDITFALRVPRENLIVLVTCSCIINIIHVCNETNKYKLIWTGGKS